MLSLILTLAVAAPAVADDPSFQVGMAQVDITPDGPIRLNGYGSRKTESEGVEQRLTARALAISDSAGEPAVLISVENCGVPAALTEAVYERLQKSVGLARDRFVIAATHTHTGPCLSGTLPILFGGPIPHEQQERIDRYTRTLMDKIEEVARAALADRRRARLAWGEGKLDFAANRRMLKDGRWVGFGVHPEGPVEHTMPLLRVTDTDGQLRAVMLGYACHCTTLGGDFNKVCGDWAGYACEAIARDHPGVLPLIIIGCGADANPQPREKLDFAQRHGESVAREVSRLLNSPLTPLDGPMTARYQRIALPFDQLPTREQWQERAQRPGPEGYHARIQLERLDRGQELPKYLPYSVQTWCFGDDLAMVFLAGEVVVDYAQRLKQECAADRLWINAYCNDIPCYIASKRILAEGGYEADTSMLFYDRPTRLAPEAEDLIIKTVHELLPRSFNEP
jgi:hypothetical protein